MPQILITTSSFDCATNAAIDKLVRAGFEIRSNPHARRLTESEVGDLLAEGEIVGMIAGVEPLTRYVLDRAQKLKVISRCGIGMDSVDLAAADDRGIRVCNTPGAPVSAVAELTLGLMLDLLRQIGQADRTIRAGGWKQMMGNLLAFQTVGIVGFGRIGRRVAELLHAFGAKVLVHDPALVDAPSYAEASDFDALLQRADVVTLHLPYNKSLHHMIGHRELALMKSSAFLVNTARGGLVDEDALALALGAGSLAGAALDTFEQEPYKGPLASLPQMLLTAHMGSYAKESRVQMEREAAENLVKGLIASGTIQF
jgi:D-3-phosphoglycerate dehydrogenase